ncbi:MAG: type II toxin-antitoxin system RelE/ParE family toxin [Pseudomonadales bacterium]|nr:type II toxin-antitoxin system RelE/ParE family toxin [Pseudomonadales bacterium]
MPSYRLTSDAQSDLIEVRRYTLTQWGVLQSKKYLLELRQTINLLSDAPRLGKHVPDITVGVFSFSHASHIIYYVLDKHQLVVFGVLHKRMVPSNHLENREII